MPAGATLALHYEAVTRDAGDVFNSYTTTDAAVVTVVSRPETGTVGRVRVTGWITGGTSGGTVALQAASEAGNSTTVKAGSWLQIGMS